MPNPAMTWPLASTHLQVPRGFMELAPSVALFLDVGVCPSADMRQDTALANATRWLSRSLTVHSMSIQLPMEV